MVPAGGSSFNAGLPRVEYSRCFMSDKPPDATPKEPRSRRHRILYGVAVALILFLIAALVLVWYRRSLTDQLEQRLKAIRAAGYPVTLLELDDWYGPPPEGENAADSYMKAFTRFKPPLDDDEVDDFEVIPLWDYEDFPEKNEPLPANVRNQIGDYVAANGDALTFLHEAAGKRECRYPLDLTAYLSDNVFDFVADYPGSSHAYRLRRAAHLLQMEAILNLAEENVEAALRSVRSHLALVRSLNREPLLTSQLIRQALLGRTVDIIQRVLSNVALTDLQLGALVRELALHENEHLYLRGFPGDRCMAILMSELPVIGRDTKQPGPPTKRLLWNLLTFLGVRDRDLIYYLDRTEEFLALGKVPYPQRLDALKELEERIMANFGAHPRYLLSGLMLAPYARAVEYDTLPRARLRAARMALAVERCRLATGHVPESLAELVPTYAPAVLTDPYDGQPLRFVKRETGYAVYSIGPDGDDDNGVFWDVDLKDGDVTISVTR